MPASSRVITVNWKFVNVAVALLELLLRAMVNERLLMALAEMLCDVVVVV